MRRSGRVNVSVPQSTWMRFGAGAPDGLVVVSWLRRGLDGGLLPWLRWYPEVPLDPGQAFADAPDLVIELPDVGTELGVTPQHQPANEADRGHEGSDRLQPVSHAPSLPPNTLTGNDVVERIGSFDCSMNCQPLIRA